MQQIYVLDKTNLCDKEWVTKIILASTNKDLLINKAKELNKLEEGKLKHKRFFYDVEEIATI